MISNPWIATFAQIRQFQELFQANFLKGHPEPRIAFLGRSNVGKSSLINSLLEGKFAQISKQPGKTRAVHFYLSKYYQVILADLPGYGFAAISRQEKQRWEGFIDFYLSNDSHLIRLFMLLDARHGPTPLDLQALEFVSQKQLPITLLFTKADTLKTQAQRRQRYEEAPRTLKKFGFGFENMIWLSTRTGVGLKELKEFLKIETSRSED